MLSSSKIDMAALSETRYAGDTPLTEVGGGYTFYCIGKAHANQVLVLQYAIK
jgi:hypothetical protein